MESRLALYQLSYIPSSKGFSSKAPPTCTRLSDPPAGHLAPSLSIYPVPQPQQGPGTHLVLLEAHVALFLVSREGLTAAPNILPWPHSLHKIGWEEANPVANLALGIRLAVILSTSFNPFFPWTRSLLRASTIILQTLGSHYSSPQPVVASGLRRP